MAYNVFGGTLNLAQSRVIFGCPAWLSAAFATRMSARLSQTRESHLDGYKIQKSLFLEAKFHSPEFMALARDECVKDRHSPCRQRKFTDNLQYLGSWKW